MRYVGKRAVDTLYVGPLEAAAEAPSIVQNPDGTFYYNQPGAPVQWRIGGVLTGDVANPTADHMGAVGSDVIDILGVADLSLTLPPDVEAFAFGAISAVNENVQSGGTVTVALATLLSGGTTPYVITTDEPSITVSGTDLTIALDNALSVTATITATDADSTVLTRPLSITVSVAPTNEVNIWQTFIDNATKEGRPIPGFNWDRATGKITSTGVADSGKWGLEALGILVVDHTYDVEFVISGALRSAFLSALAQPDFFTTADFGVDDGTSLTMAFTFTALGANFELSFDALVGPFNDGDLTIVSGSLIDRDAGASELYFDGNLHIIPYTGAGSIGVDQDADNIADLEKLEAAAQGADNGTPTFLEPPSLTVDLGSIDGFGSSFRFSPGSFLVGTVDFTTDFTVTRLTEGSVIHSSDELKDAVHTSTRTDHGDTLRLRTAITDNESGITTVETTDVVIPEIANNLWTAFTSGSPSPTTWKSEGQGEVADWNGPPDNEYVITTAGRSGVSSRLVLVLDSTKTYRLVYDRPVAGPSSIPGITVNPALLDQVRFESNFFRSSDTDGPLNQPIVDITIANPLNPLIFDFISANFEDSYIIGRPMLVEVPT